MHLTNHDYFDYGKTQRPPFEPPCRNKDGARSGISGVYLWLLLGGDSIFLDKKCITMHAIITTHTLRVHYAHAAANLNS